MARRLLVLGAAVLALSCMSPSVPHPLTNESRFLCCNLHYEKDALTDVNYQRGTLVPFGTHVTILEVGRNRVKFRPDGHPALTLAHRYGKGAESMDQYLGRLFVTEDPRLRLRRVPAKTRTQIEQGVVAPGMTREQVLMALGYPPAHRTPSLDSPKWTYWENRWATFEVFFEGDTVNLVQR
jgi:hypothetical protein